MTREDTAREFAAAMGWEWSAEDYDFAITHPTIHGATTWWCDLPPTGAPLWRHLAFVGRVAEALHPDDPLSAHTFAHRVLLWSAPRGPGSKCLGPDASHQAMYAAIEARKAP